MLRWTPKWLSPPKDAAAFACPPEDAESLERLCGHLMEQTGATQMQVYLQKPGRAAQLTWTFDHRAQRRDENEPRPSPPERSNAPIPVQPAPSPPGSPTADAVFRLPFPGGFGVLFFDSPMTESFREELSLQLTPTAPALLHVATLLFLERKEKRAEAADQSLFEALVSKEATPQERLGLFLEQIRAASSADVVALVEISGESCVVDPIVQRQALGNAFSGDDVTPRLIPPSDDVPVFQAQLEGELALGIPLLLQISPTQCLALFKVASAFELEEEQLRTLQPVAESFRMLIKREAVISQFLPAFEATLVDLARTIDERSAATRGHHGRVESVCERLAAHHQLDKAKTETLLRAARIHDVGRAMAVYGNGTAEEFNHPSSAAQLLHGLPDCEPLAALIVHHHERADGFGYPRAQPLGALDLSARTLALAERIVEATELKHRSQTPNRWAEDSDACVRDALDAIAAHAAGAISEEDLAAAAIAFAAPH